MRTIFFLVRFQQFQLSGSTIWINDLFYDLFQAWNIRYWLETIHYFVFDYYSIISWQVLN